MAFVNEVLSEADKEFFKSLKIISRLSSYGELVSVPQQWTIDKGRKAIFIILEGRGGKWDDIPLFMALIWKGHLVRIEAFEEAIGNVEAGYEVRWKVKKIIADTTLVNEASRISNLIIDALQVVGYSYKPCTVYIDEIAAPVFLQEV